MIIHADARRLPLVDGCVQTCVTSPPYWGLRDYGHVGQIGLESSPDAYVAAMVGVFREVHRVLRQDGTVWLNLGDSYAGSWGAQSREHAGKHAPNVSALSANQVKAAQIRESCTGSLSRTPGLKSKDLVGIPWRVAFALKADGWYLRSDIIWAKPNPLPESVTDRPTKSHEYLFLLAKSASYYYDAAAIFEPYAESTLREVQDGYEGTALKDYAAAGVQNTSDTKRRIIESMRKKNISGNMDERGVGRSTASLSDRLRLAREAGVGPTHGHPEGRNRRTVWTIPTRPYPRPSASRPCTPGGERNAGAHFATMPEALVEPCILAGCPLGGLVLDPFLGSGTVGAVAERLGRRWVGCDLNPAYHALAKKRTAQRGIRFDAESVEAYTDSDGGGERMKTKQETSSRCEHAAVDYARLAAHFGRLALGEDEATARLAEVQAERDQLRWQPIETAPKDGASIDVFTGTHRVTDVFWQREWRSWSTRKGRIVYEATHWMPLPAPPPSPQGDQETR